MNYSLLLTTSINYESDLLTANHMHSMAEFNGISRPPVYGGKNKFYLL